MNRIYRSLWNDATGTFIAVSENARGAGKKTSTCTGPCGAAAPAMRALAISLLIIGNGAYAAPVGGVVTAGGATIVSGTGGNVVITQNTQNAAINWNSFNVAAGESVRFVQPNSSAVTLNRVVGVDPSSILGNLSANGKVFLVNPNGIVFGKGASVNVGGLVASSLNIGDTDFMAGNYRFAGAAGGAITNLGTINAPGGYVALLGANVSNGGVISARLGSVALAAGNAITLDVAGDGLLNVAINEGAVNALVQNGGLIEAAGGEVLLSARAAGGLLQGAVNNSGVIEARSLQHRNGTIRLLADPTNGTAQVSGTLDASGPDAGQTGGTIQVLGNTVTLTGATVNASGDAGGGLIHIGGGFYGDATIPAAHSTSLDGTAVHADAISTGHGGRIAVWAANDLSVNAQLTARGGARSGNGGFIETSGKHVKLGSSNQVITLAPNGRTGTWLLDPIDWTIANANGDETPMQVRTSLASSDRLITATNNITVASALVWTTGQKLELKAGNNVLIKAEVTASTKNSAIVFTAGNDVLVEASVTASALNSSVIMTAGRDISVVSTTADGGGSIALVAKRNVTANGPISADMGSVTMIADNDGTGPGPAGGTVTFVGPSLVKAMSTTIRFNPATYAATSTEIASYATRVTGSVDARAWVFGQGVNKVYDGKDNATLTLRGNPNVGNDVTPVAGTATFDNQNVGTSKTVTFTGYTLGGGDLARFALFAPYNDVPGAGTTTADITPAPLSIKANNASKSYGETLVPLPSAYTQVGLVNNETMLGVTQTSAGSAASASVAGSAYAIVPSDATGGTFTPSNYAITYLNGTMTIAPKALTVTSADVSRPYDSNAVYSSFTTSGLANGESIGSVTQVSPATSGGSAAPGTYAITPSNATGGTFDAGNYAITYANGALTVGPMPYVPPPVVTPPPEPSPDPVTPPMPVTPAPVTPPVVEIPQAPVTPEPVTPAPVTPAPVSPPVAEVPQAPVTPPTESTPVLPPTPTTPVAEPAPPVIAPPVTPDAPTPDAASALPGFATAAGIQAGKQALMRSTAASLATPVSIAPEATLANAMPAVAVSPAPADLQTLARQVSLTQVQAGRPVAASLETPTSVRTGFAPVAPVSTAAPLTDRKTAAADSLESADTIPVRRIKKQDRN
jgi:filamentous hemagglutinin family protein